MLHLLNPIHHIRTPRDGGIDGPHREILGVTRRPSR